MPSTVSKSSVRSSAVAGSFYPESAKTLERDIDALLEQAVAPNSSGNVLGIVSPHAGYMYSGLTAAHAYKAVKGVAYDAVIIVGPSHHEYFQGVSIYPGSGYRTPLGTVPIHDEFRSAIVREEKRIFLSVAGHRAEHSVEVQIPFLQRTLGSFLFVPIVMGDQTIELCENLAEAISTAVFGHNVLLVASSEAVSLDRRVIQMVEAYDPIRLMERLDRHEMEACGGGPIVAVMLAAQKLGANKGRVIQYCNSGDVTGKKDAVVGYLSAMFCRELSDFPLRVN
jgi:hypothetical protein